MYFHFCMSFFQRDQIINNFIALQVPEGVETYTPRQLLAWLQQYDDENEEGTSGDLNKQVKFWRPCNWP